MIINRLQMNLKQSAVIQVLVGCACGSCLSIVVSWYRIIRFYDIITLLHYAQLLIHSKNQFVKNSCVFGKGMDKWHRLRMFVCGQEMDGKE